jgi:hypothetical protein
MNFDGGAGIELHGEDRHKDVQSDVGAFNHLKRARQNRTINVQYDVIATL